MIILKKNGKPIMTTEYPVWTRYQPNGYNVVCDLQDADGIVVNGIQYHILGKPENGYDTVQVEEVPDGTNVTIEPSPEQKLQLAVAELGTTTAQSKTEVQLAIAELAATMTGGAE